jgi:SAM-dependent methyltransferase
MTQKPYLNLGCGRVILPAPKPVHYALIDNITEYALWHNVDRNQQPGVDEVVDIFRYPFPWADNSFDGALCAHLCEHIPHEIQLAKSAREFEDGSMQFMPMIKLKDVFRLSELQDGWFAFFSELHRVLTPGSIIHVLSPYGWSDGGITDPSHTRLLTPSSFQHSMQPNPDAPFAYATGGLNLEMVEPPRVNITPEFQHLAGNTALFQQALSTQINVVYEFAVKLRVVK